MNKENTSFIYTRKSSHTNCCSLTSREFYELEIACYASNCLIH